MQNFGRIVTVLAMVALLGVFFGCASKHDPKPSGTGMEYSGFLKSYPPFTKGADGIDKRYTKKGVDFGKYNQVMMDEVVFYFKHDTEYHGIKPSEITDLAEDFHTAFIEEMGDMLTGKPGPGVVRMRLAVTGIEPSNPVTSGLTTVVPVGLAVSLVRKGATGSYTGVGSASMEVEFLDSMTNERIAAGIDTAPGGKLDIGKLSPAKAAFKFWAKRLHAFMQQSVTKK